MDSDEKMSKLIQEIKFTTTKSRSKRTKEIQGMMPAVDPKVKEKAKLGTFQTRRGHLCTCCGRIYDRQVGYFPVSNSMLFAENNGYVPICKDCLDGYYKKLIQFYSGNEEHALEHCCRLLDWYYSPEVSSMLRSSTTAQRSKVLVYPQKMNLQQIKTKGTTYLDTIDERAKNAIPFDEMTVAGSAPDSESEEEPYVPSEATKQFFGEGWKAKEYKYMEDQYNDWSTRYECKTKAQEELFKNLCVSQLAIQRAQFRDNPKEINEAMRTFQDLLGTANLKPNQNNDNSMVEQNTFGTLIKKWENEAPIAEPEEEWRDVDNIYKYIDTFFTGHLCNLVHVKNDKEEAYREEMEKYTVKPPKYEESDAGETSLLDKYSDKGDKNDSGQRDTDRIGD